MKFVKKLFQELCIKGSVSRVIGFLLWGVKNSYRTRAIISRGLYIYYPIFHCCLYSRVVNIRDNSCIKQENSSKNQWFIIKSGFKSRVDYNGVCTVCIFLSKTEHTPMKLLYIVNRHNAGSTKIGHNFRK